MRNALGLLMAALLMAAGSAPAQVRSSANFAIKADGIDAGGGVSSSANFTQRASMGQSFATPPMVGTNFSNQPGLQSNITAVSSPGDTQAPSVPAGVQASAVSSSQINLSWSASTDNVAVALYQVFRGGSFRATVNAPTTSFGDTGLTASTNYSYTVAACDAALNCSAQSSSASATTLAGSSYTASLESGFNLIGNSLNLTIDVAATFGNQDAPVAGVTPNVVSIWKWNASLGKWNFYSPQLTAAGNASYAASHNFDLLSTINPGEGYWVNAILPMNLPPQNATIFTWSGFSFSALPSGFNLVAHGLTLTPSQFNNNVSVTPPSPGVIPTDNFVSLWAWDAVFGKWYFYSPLLEAGPTGLAAVKAYADSHSYLHFQDSGKMIEIGTGFWVNRP